MIQVQVRIASDEQVHVAVAIIVSPGCAGTESATADAGFFSYILELATTQIVIEHVAVVSGHEQVKLTVIVVVSDRNAHAPAKSCQPRLLGNVFKFAIWLLMVKSDHGVAPVQHALYRRAIHQENIQQPIV